MSEVKDKELLLTKIKLILLFLIFGLPLVVALIFARMSDEGLPGFIGTTNNGDLILPVIPLTPFTLDAVEGGVIDTDAFNEFWTLVYISTDGCDSICQQQVYAMRQLRLMLGREAMRVQRLFVYAGLTKEETNSVQTAFPEMLMGTAGSSELELLARQFEVKGLEGEDRLYLVDPVGNLMMSFPQDMNPRLIYKDLKKLLRATKG